MIIVLIPGPDKNEKTEGRERHIAVDTLGLLIALGLSAASFADSPIGRQVLDHLAYRTPSVSKAWVDGGYNAKVADHSVDLGIDVDVVNPRPRQPRLQSPATPLGRRARAP